ncbi:Protein ALP1-like [Labeo rohita]|uniref:Protein ALP1-like n=1 Tax=Labeo rohita TaxID=84645 RepID=A0ABQ8M4B9_LABRO|nr:Protein ALP1-like [Labeo rohita]
MNSVAQVGGQRIYVILYYFWLSRQDLKVDFRLSRDSMEALLWMLSQDEAHGWGHHITVLITVYWLAHDLSYSVVARAFKLSGSFVCRMVHTGAIKIAALHQHVIQFPAAQDLKEMQAVCDGKGRFLFVGYPCSVYDTRVLRNSKIYKEALYPTQGYFLVGDGSCSCIIHPVAISTPYQEPIQGRM